MIPIRLCLAVLPLVVALGLPAGAEVYRYVDEDGNPHFSDSITSIPPRYRDQVADVHQKLRTETAVNVIPGLNPPLQGADDNAGGGPEADPAGELSRAMSSDAAGDQAMRAAAGQMWTRLGAWLLLIVLLGFAVGTVIGASILMLACKLAAPETPAFGRACAIILLQALVGIAVSLATAGVGLGLGVFSGGSATSLGLLRVADLLVCVAAYAGVLSAMTDIGFPRALWVTIVYCLLVLLIAIVPLAIVLLFHAI